jgi:two-component system sensor histidine kinase KdpD
MRPQQDRRRVSFSLDRLQAYALAIGSVVVLTGAMYLAGRETLGEGVIALLYLVPIGWATARWGQGPGIAAAVSAALAFNFFFIPPYYTFYIGSLEGWLLLGIFLAVAIVIVGRVQSGLSQAQAREREAIFMYELSAALAGGRTGETVARILAEHIQQLYQAALVQVYVEGEARPVLASAPGPGTAAGKPDIVLPILTAFGLLGEIRLWQGEVQLPPAEDRLLQNFADQGGLALHRARLVEAGEEQEGIPDLKNYA